ncbi:hypothetical protein Tco_1220857 [Tanacetum coccineum]
MIVMTSMIELESLFVPSFDEYFNEVNQVVSKSSDVTTADESVKSQQRRDSTSSTSTLATNVTADGNFEFMNENKGIMPAKVELTLEQSQQGVSDDVLHGKSNTSVLEDPTLEAGNPIKEVLSN